MGSCLAAEPSQAPASQGEPVLSERNAAVILPSIRAIMHEAAVLGMPSAEGANLFAGQLTSPHRLPPGQAHQDREPARIHARLADGSWLVDLWDWVPNQQLDPTEIAALHPVSLADAAKPDGFDVRERFPWRHAVLRFANLMQAGVAQADEALLGEYGRQRDQRTLLVGAIAPYPREALGTSPESCLRLVCRRWFLERLDQDPGAAHWGDAAVAIAPPDWHQATRQDLARRQASMAKPSTPPDPTSAVGQLAAWSPTGELGVDNLLLPALDEPTLIACAGDLSPVHDPGPEAATVGDRALLILGERWGVDPALCAGRPVQAPWDDVERQAVAQGLQAWWRRSAGKAWSDRFASVASTVPVAELERAFLRRTQQRQEQRFGVTDRLRWRTYQGDPPVPYADDEHAVEQAVGVALGRAWASSPPQATASALLPLVERFRGIPEFRDAVSSWPKTGPMAAIVAAWDDAQGRSGGVDALVAAWLAHPERDEPILLDVDRSSSALPAPTDLKSAQTTPLVWWVANGTAARWTALQALLQGPMESLATARLLAGCGRQWFAPLSDTWGVNLTQALLDQALGDPRTLAPALRAWLVHSLHEPWLSAETSPDDPQRQAEARNAIAIPAGDLRVCDLALFQAIANLAFGVEAYQQHPELQTLTLASAVNDRDRVIAAVRPMLGPEVAQIMQGLNRPAQARGVMAWAVPAGPPVPTVPDIPSGMTSDEAHASQAALAQAQTLGFPDLHGAVITHGRLSGNGAASWWGLHVHGRDGTWLADGSLPLLAAQVRASGAPLAPAQTSRPGESELLSLLTGEAQERYRANAVVAPDDEGAAGLGIAALTWWVNGSDPTGRSVVEACLLAEAGQHATVGTFPTDGYRGGTDTSRSVSAVDIPTGVRRLLARWFCDQLMLSQAQPEAARWAAAARAILAPADRGDWEPMISRLEGRVAIPLVAPPTAGLPEQLASWSESLSERSDGTWREPVPPPATRAQTAALIGLLHETRPSRWVRDGIPMTLGDAALQALNQLWGFDWRWIALTDATVAAAFPASPASSPVTGDGWRLAGVHWTDAVRAQVARSLQQWWTSTGSSVPDAPVLMALQQAPFAVWADILPNMPHELLGPAAGALLGRRLAQIPQPEDPTWALRSIVVTALCFPTDATVTAAMAAWPASTWLRNLTTMRTGIGGDEASLDAWFAAPLSGQGAPPAQRPEDPSFEGFTSTWMNLGLIVERPSAARRATLRAVLAGDLQCPATLWLISLVGLRHYPMVDGLEDQLCGATPQLAAYLPAQLAMDGLADRRPIPAVVLGKLQDYSEQTSGEAVDLTHCVAPRVCDQVAARLMRHGHQFSRTWDPPLYRQEDRFLAEAVVQRDQDIAQLTASFTALVGANVQACQKLVTQH